jgi:hypothetical protein
MSIAAIRPERFSFLNTLRYFLAYIFHIFLPLNNPANHVQHQPLVFRHQKPERIVIPVQNLLYQFRIIHS